jgi:hypothetical protein
MDGTGRKGAPMRGRLWFLGGLGVGYMLGTRAGRERYDQIVSTARRFWESPTVQEAAGVVQAQATKLYEQGRQAVEETMHRDGHELAGPAAETGSDESWESPARREHPANSF